MNRNELRKIFTETVMLHSTAGSPSDLRKTVDDYWTQVELHYDKQPYHNLNAIGTSLGMIPFWLQSMTTFNLVVVAAVMQWVGPTNSVNSTYALFKLRNLMQWPEPQAKRVNELCKVRLNLEQPIMAPDSIIYDYNFMRLAYPRATFLFNQASVIAELISAGDGRETVLGRQLGIFEFIQKRGRVFVNHPVRQEYEAMALENIEAYIPFLKRNLQQLKIKSESLLTV